MRPLNGGASRAPGRSRMRLSMSSTSWMRSKLTAAFESVLVIFDRSLHRLVGLPQIQQEDDQHAGAELPGDHEPRAVAEHQAGADRDDDVDHRRELAP